MQKTYVIGDIHGGFKALIQVLERAGVSSSDTLIFLGDYVDGWSQPVEVVDFLINLSNKQPCYFIQGNHEELLLQWLKNQKDNPLWRQHGGESSIKAYQNVSDATRQKHIKFFENLQPYYLDEQKRLFVHAGFSNLKGVDYEYFTNFFWWDRTLWELALATDKQLSVSESAYPARLKIYHEIFIGHTPTTHFGETVPMNRQNVWNIDTGAAFDGKLTIMDVNSKQFWQSDCLQDLYPDEKGRNAG